MLFIICYSYMPLVRIPTQKEFSSISGLADSIAPLISQVLILFSLLILELIPSSPVSPTTHNPLV